MRNLSAALDASGGDLRWLLTTVTEVQARIRALEQSLALIKPRGPSQLALPVAPAAAEPAPAALDANGGLSGEELAALLDGLQEMQDRIRGLEEALARAESGNAGAPAPEAAPPSAPVSSAASHVTRSSSQASTSPARPLAASWAMWIATIASPRC